MKFLLVNFIVLIPLLMTHKTGVVLFLALLGMAPGTVIHLHTIRELLVPIETGNAFSPDIDTVTG